MGKRFPSQASVRLIATVGAWIALALAASGVRAADTSSHAVRVLNGRGHVVAIFRSAKCGINGFGLIAIASSQGYRLHVHIDPFTGFHHYHLARGHASGVFIALYSPSGVDFASDYVPPYPVHGGGAINFSDHGKLMGVGFSPMFSRDGSDAVTVAGVLTCKYPTKRRR